jgi:hypothetical protein
MSAMGAIGNLNLSNLLNFNTGGNTVQPGSTPAPAAQYTAPDGSVWASKDAYDAAHPANTGNGGFYSNWFGGIGGLIGG